MKLKTKLYLRLLAIYIIVNVAFYLNFLSSGNLQVFLIDIIFSSIVTLIIGTYAIRKRLKAGSKRKWKMPRKVMIMYLLSFLMIFVGISLNTLYPVLSSTLAAIAILMILISMRYAPKEMRKNLPISKIIMIIYVIFLLSVSTFSEANDVTFFIGGTLGLVSLYSLIRPKKILLVISMIYFALVELVILSIIYVVPLGDAILGFYAWAVINIFAIAYTFMLFRSLGLKKKVRRR